MTKYKMTIRKNGNDLCLGIDEILEGTKEDCIEDFFIFNAEILEDHECTIENVVATEINDDEM